MSLRILHAFARRFAARALDGQAQDCRRCGPRISCDSRNSRCKASENIVFERRRCLEAARIALAAAAAEQLAVDARRFVELGAGYVQAAELGDAVRQAGCRCRAPPCWWPP